MSIRLRPGTPADAAVCGAICFEAFKAIDDEHNFPWDFPSADVATGLLKTMLSNPGFYAVVAENDGNVVGSNFLDERGPIAGVGPISVDPASQNQTIGRRLMGAVLDRASERHAAGVRLLQSAFHNRSLCLYTKLGFETRETISKINGAPLFLEFPATMCGRLEQPTGGLQRDLPASARTPPWRRTRRCDRGGNRMRRRALGRITAYAQGSLFSPSRRRDNQG